MLYPIKSKIKRVEPIGFDIETYGDENKFIMASLFFSDDNVIVFNKKYGMIEYILKNPEMFNKRIIFAHNLSFDFLGVFGDSDYMKDFYIIQRGSDFISATSYVHNGIFTPFKIDKNDIKIMFHDTMSFFKGNLKSVGKIIGIEKKEYSDIGNKPQNKKQYDDLVKYNIRDSKICTEFVNFLQDGFNDLGCNIKSTIASTSLDLFKRRFLKEKLYSPTIKQIEIMIKGYYGGRTEILKRGYNNEKINIYDFNSVYSSVMKKSLYPHPNFMRYCRNVSKVQLNDYEGVTYVEMQKDSKDLPFLQIKHDNKLIFPDGIIKGFYTHKEIRTAIEYNYKLLKIGKGFYSKKVFSPFKDFVDLLYNKRLEYKKQNSPMEIIPKILLNSLYGKFATRLDNKTELKNSIYLTHEDIETAQEIGDSNYYRVKKVYNDKNKPAFINPILSIYTTANAREKLYRAIHDISDDVFYMDTDSIFTTKSLNNSSRLGDLKLEYTANEYYLVKPKFYALKIKDNYKCKIKGCRNLNQHFNDFENILRDKKHTYIKFMKMRESMIQHMAFNTKVEVEKEFSLEDNKRDWNGSLFSTQDFQDSFALKV